MLIQDQIWAKFSRYATVGLPCGSCTKSSGTKETVWKYQWTTGAGRAWHPPLTVGLLYHAFYFHLLSFLKFLFYLQINLLLYYDLPMDLLITVFLCFHISLKILSHGSQFMCIHSLIQYSAQNSLLLLSIFWRIPLNFGHSALGHILSEFPYSFYALSWSMVNTFICTFMKLFQECMSLLQTHFKFPKAKDVFQVYLKTICLLHLSSHHDTPYTLSNRC